MQKLKGLNEAAWRYLDNIPPSAWVKTHYSHHPKCDNITNNMCEVWNAKIVRYRSKPIITLCEELRSYIMRRMAAHKRQLATMRGKVAPTQQKRLDQLKKSSNLWTPSWTGNMVQEMYEVCGHGERVGVNLTSHTCACNVWQLTGLPCEHAIAAIAHKGEPPENYVHQWLTLDALHATYAHTLNPVNSQQYWPASDHPRPDPPTVKRPIGRPKKHRRKDATETESSASGGKLKRSHSVKCSKCGGAGHYAKTCKGPPAPPRIRTTPVSVPIESRPEEEIPLSQGGPAEENPSQEEACVAPTTVPVQNIAGLSAETINAASIGNAARLRRIQRLTGLSK